MASTGHEADVRPSPSVLRAQRGAGHAPRRQEVRAASRLDYSTLDWTLGGFRHVLLGDGPMSELGPGRVETFFDPQKLHATGRDGPRRDRLSLFLLYRVWSQSGRNLKPC